MNDDIHEDNPFEEGPEVVESDLVCWKDNGRVCGPDCVAFDVRSLEQPALNACWLINIGRSAAKSLATLADGAKALTSFPTSSTEDPRIRARELKEKIDELDNPPPEVTT